MNLKPIARLLVGLAFLSTLAGAAAPVGVLSYIEILPELANGKEDITRQVPFVELIHVDRLSDCKKNNWKNCLKYEWSVPFVPDSSAYELEEKLSRAWNRFDARTTARMNLEINLNQYAIRCWTNINVDFLIGAWEGNRLGNLDGADFCDGLTFADSFNDSLPWNWSSYPGLCGQGDGQTWVNQQKINDHYASGFKHAMTTYYPQYWKDVAAAVLSTAPANLGWPGILPTQTDGSALIPVMSFAPNPTQYTDLAARSLKTDLRGPAYLLQSYPLIDSLAPWVRKALLTPGFETRADYPGLPKLEALKATLTDRTGIHDYMWKYGLSPKPEGKSGTATLPEYEGVGAVPFLHLINEVVSEPSPRMVAHWRVCILADPPGLVPYPAPMPFGYVLITRTNTKWETVPEGWGINYINGVPTF